MVDLQAQIVGPDDSPYADGVFSLSINITDRYPLEPPRARFLTKIYHPNIDSEGRICLDTLKMPPQGSWSPSVNINTLLLTIRLLLAHPNADDGLVPDITEQYKRDKQAFIRDAKMNTLKYALTNNLSLQSDSAKNSNASAASVLVSVPSTIINKDKNCVKTNTVESSSGDDSEFTEDTEDNSDSDSDNEIGIKRQAASAAVADDLKRNKK